MKETNTIQASKPETVIQKYTMQEFWDSLYYQCCDEDDDYDGFFHIISTINGTQIKIPIADIIHSGARYQNKVTLPLPTNEEKK